MPLITSPHSYHQHFPPLDEEGTPNLGRRESSPTEEIVQLQDDISHLFERYVLGQNYPPYDQVCSLNDRIDHLQTRTVDHNEKNSLAELKNHLDLARIAYFESCQFESDLQVIFEFPPPISSTCISAPTDKIEELTELLSTLSDLPWLREAIQFQIHMYHRLAMRARETIQCACAYVFLELSNGRTVHHSPTYQTMIRILSPPSPDTLEKAMILHTLPDYHLCFTFTIDSSEGVNGQIQIE